MSSPWLKRGASAEDVASAVEDRWHIEYPATNNAVANGALVAMAVWFGGGDWLQTVNHAFRAADFTDADCNAANAGAVVGAMKGTRGLPPWLIDRLGDRIRGDELGSVKLTPPVDESLAELAKRTGASRAPVHRREQRHDHRRRSLHRVAGAGDAAG